MSALMAERRELGEEGRQESLFEAPAPPRPPGPRDEPAELRPPSGPRDEPAQLRPPSGPRDEPAQLRPPSGPRDEAAEADEIARLEAFAPAPEAVPPFEATVDALVDEPFAAPATEEMGERREPRHAGMPLAGPTLDDVLSRVWEGLATGLPAACPVCHGEVEAAPGRPLAGRCRSCGTAID